MVGGLVDEAVGRTPGRVGLGVSLAREGETEETNLCFYSCCQPYSEGWTLPVCFPAKESTDPDLCLQKSCGVWD